MAIFTSSSHVFSLFELSHVFYQLRHIPFLFSHKGLSQVRVLPCPCTIFLSRLFFVVCLYFFLFFAHRWVFSLRFLLPCLESLGDFFKTLILMARGKLSSSFFFLFPFVVASSCSSKWGRWSGFSLHLSLILGD